MWNLGSWNSGIQYPWPEGEGWKTIKIWLKMKWKEK